MLTVGELHAGTADNVIPANATARLTLRTRWIFVCLLSVGMVLAHYSTAYLAIPLLLIAAVVQWGTSWFRPRSAAPSSNPEVIS